MTTTIQPPVLVRPLALDGRSRPTATATLPPPPRFTQPQLALVLGEPSVGPRRNHPALRQRPGSGPGSRPPTGPGGPRRPGGAPPPTAASARLEAWAGSLVQAVVEVVAGDRPLTQLVRWTSTGAYTEIARKQRLTAREWHPTGPGRLRQQVASVRVSRPSDAAAEIAARLDCGDRSRALAARMELIRDRWVCTSIEFG